MTILNNDQSITEVAMIGKMSIERCLSYIAHLRAIVHLCHTELPLDDDCPINDSLYTIMGNIEHELSHSEKIFDYFQ